MKIVAGCGTYHAVKDTLTLEFDGGSRGNPGPAGIGVVVRAPDRTPLVTLGRFIGVATNNVAEYRALICALEQAQKLGAKKILIRGDSELIVRQMIGQYRVKNADLKVLYDEAQSILREFDDAKFEHNLREKNKLADKLANLAMDRKGEVTDADESPIDVPAAHEPKVGEEHVCPRCGCVVQIKHPSSIRPHQLRPFACQCGMRMDRKTDAKK